MNNKLNEVLESYRKTLARKQRVIKEYADMKNSPDGFNGDMKAELEYTKLYYEINQLEKFIEDLEYIAK